MIFEKTKAVRQIIGVLALSILLVSMPQKSYAQFENLFADTITGQQDTIDSVVSDVVTESVEGTLTEEQVNAITAAALLRPLQEQEDAEEAAEADAASRSRKLNVDKIMSEYEGNQGIIDAFTAYQDTHARAPDATPMPLGALQNLPKENRLFEDGEAGLPFNLRKDAIREAAISYGARGGLAWRTYEIRQELTKRERYLDRIYDFRQLLIAAPSGLMIEPPIISESINSMLIEVGGQEAAVSDRIYNIINNAKIVSAPRTWRSYLERTWPAVEPPPDVLRPQNEEEREFWIEMVTKGWKEGVKQANEIFSEDLNRLVADFRGMVRYRLLLSQGMISKPYALQVDRGVTGNGKEMRVGDRAVQITGVPQLITGANRWKPASR